MNAYFTGPIRDRSGVFHIAWVWRDTPDCATNHDISYAQSRDLIHWTTSDGKPLSLPITIDTAEIVDPAPSGQGVCNGGPKIGFDSKGRVVLSYYRFDARGKTQLFNARREEQGWKIYQTSDWDYRWNLGGTGSIAPEIRVGPVSLDRRWNLTQLYRHAKYGLGTWQLDEATLKPIGNADAAAQRNPTPPDLNRVESSDPEMKVNFASDLGDAAEPGIRYLLRWESRPPHRDQPYPRRPTQAEHASGLQASVARTKWGNNRAVVVLCLAGWECDMTTSCPPYWRPVCSAIPFFPSSRYHHQHD